MELSLEIILRNIALTLILARQIYWYFTEIYANKENPKSKPITFIQFLKRQFLNLIIVIVIVQLLGIDILPFQNNNYLRILGFIIVFTSVLVSFLSRRELGNNWAHGAEFQIKKAHTLVTSGIYKYIRHPIYVGVIGSYIGVEILVGSYLFFPFLTLIYTAYIQSKWEERILIKEFGAKYKDYMKGTKMFIPHLW